MKYVITFIMLCIAYVLVGKLLLSYPVITIFVFLGILFTIWGVQDFKKTRDR